MAKPQVLVIGRNCVDYIAVVDQFPDEDKKTPLSKRTIIYENSTLPNVEFDAKMQALALDSGAVLLSPDVTFLSKSLGALQPQLPPIIYDAERWRQGID
jgi:hypothetical protein